MKCLGEKIIIMNFIDFYWLKKWNFLIKYQQLQFFFSLLLSLNFIFVGFLFVFSSNDYILLTLPNLFYSLFNKFYFFEGFGNEILSLIFLPIFSNNSYILIPYFALVYINKKALLFFAIYNPSYLDIYLYLSKSTLLPTNAKIISFFAFYVKSLTHTLTFSNDFLLTIE